MKINQFSLCIAVLSVVKCDTVVYEDLAGLDKQLAECRGIDIREATIIETQRRYLDNSWTSEDVTGCYIARITAMNPALQSVLEVDPDALIQARSLDKSLKDTGKLIGPLHGIPILLKDSIGAVGRLNTTAGSYALLSTKPKKDAVVVRRLRQAGAIILGKANLAEFSGMIKSSDGSDWSARGGQPISAYNSKFPVSGSSSGSAVSVSANLCMLSLGVDTLGSVISPSSYGMTVGFRATSGSISNRGVIPLIPSMDMVGPITRNVEDSIIVTHVLGDSELRETIQNIIQRTVAKKDGTFIIDLVKEMKIGIVENLYYNTTPEAEVNSHRVVKENLIRDFNVTIVPDIHMDLNFEGGHFITVLIEGFKNGLNNYLVDDVLQVGSEGISSLKDIIEFNNNNSDKLKYGQVNMVQVEETAKGIDSEAFKKAKDSFTRSNQEKLEAVFNQNNLDALMAPSFINGDSSTPITSFAVGAGYPMITIPIGQQGSGEPFGLSLVGFKGAEDKLMKLALAVERATYSPRRKPEFSQVD